MPSTDDRVVAMHFDNVTFEKKVADTIASMDKLKASLDVSGASKGLADLRAAGNNFDLSHMAGAIENISNKFSAMGAVAFSVINNIVSRAVDAGVQLTNALSLAPMVGGFQEYETNMNSIQTILANTRSDGTNLEQVSAALEELNLYSDKTIYNFSQMARNIGTFTAAGVSLETSTGAIKGIANLAAVSGSNAEQAATAMYQLSQALAAGSVKLMDWNSVVNAGMGGEVFKKALFETGKSLGTIKDIPMDMTFEEWEAAGNKFRETLQDGWITADVLTNTLAGFTGDLTEAQILSMGYTKEQAAEIMEMGKVAQDAATKVKTFTQLMSTIKESIGSGWAQTFKIIFGDFEEARTLFTGFSEFFGGFAKASADARNKVLKGWEKLGGRNILIQSLMYAVKALTDVLTPLKEAFREIFPKKTATNLYAMTVNMREFFYSLLPTEKTMENLKRIFLGVFSAIDIGIEIIKGIWSVFKALFNTLAGASDGKILAFFAEIGDKIVALRESLVKGKGIQHFFEDLIPKIVGFATKFIEKFKEILGITKEVTGFFQNGFGGTETKSAEGIESVANRIGLAVGKVRDFIADFIENFSNLDNYFRRGMDWGALAGDGPAVALAGTLGKAFQEVKDFVEKAITALGNFKDKVVDVATSLSESASGLLKRIFGGDAEGDIKKIEGMSDKLNGAGDKLKAFRDKVSELGKGGAGKSPKEIFEELGASGETLGDKFGGVADTLQGVWDRITTGIGGMKGKLEEFISFIQDFVGGAEESTGGAASKATKGVTKGKYGGSADTMTRDEGFGAEDAGTVAAGGVLAGILLIFRDLRKLIPDVRGLFKNVTKSVEEITGVFEAMQLKLKAEALQEIGKSIALITASMVVLSLMDTGSLITAATAIGVVVGQLVGAMAVLSKATTGASGAKLAVMAAAMVGMATGVLAMSFAAKLMSTIDIDELVKGVGAISVLLGALALAAGRLSKLEFGGAGGLLLMGFALNKIADAVLIFGKMDLADLAQGMGALVVSLFLLADFTDHLPDGSHLLRAGAGIAIMALGLNLLATAAKIFATMSWEEMAKGLIGVGAALGSMVLALKFLPTDMKILAGAGALLIMSVALQMLATALGVIAALSTDDMTKSLIALGVSLGILAAAAFLMQGTIVGAAAIALISVSLGSLANALGLFSNLSWGDLIGGLLKLGVALGAIAIAALVLAPAVVAIGALGIALLALGAGFALMGAGIFLIGEGFQAVAEAGEKAVPVFMDLVKGLISLIPDFIGAVADGLLMLAQKILDAAPGLISAMTKVLSALLDSALELVPKAAKVMGKFFTEMLKVAKEIVPEAVDAGLTFLMSLLDGIENNIGEITKTVANIITNFLDALSEKLPQLIESAYQFLKALIKGVVVKLGQIGLEFLPIGLSLLQGIWDGIWGGITWLVDKILSLFDPIINAFKSMFGIASPSTVMAEIGLWLIEGLWNGISGAITWLLDMISGLITTIIDAFVGAITWLVPAAWDMITGFLTGLAEAIPEVTTWFIELPGKILGWIGNVVDLLWDKGWEVLKGFVNGYGQMALTVAAWFMDLPGKILEWIGNILELLFNKGKQIIRGLYNGAIEMLETVGDWFIKMPSKILGWIGDALSWLFDKGWDIIRGLYKGILAMWDGVIDWLQGMKDRVLGWISDAAGWLEQTGYDVIMGFWKGLKAAWDWMWKQVTTLFGLLAEEIEGELEVRSPSRWAMWVGEMVGKGLGIGIVNSESGVRKSVRSMLSVITDGMVPETNTMSKSIAGALLRVTDQLTNMEEFNPVITPVLDLTNVERNAARLSGIFGSGSTMTANVTAQQTAALAAESIDVTGTTSSTSAGISFTQINNSPEALSTSDLYRQTRNQISMAKEELKIS